MFSQIQLQARAEALSLANRRGYVVRKANANDRLQDALQRCIEAEQNLPEILANVPPPEDPRNKIEVDSLNWKRDMIEAQVTRAAYAARERTAYLLTIRTDQDWEREKELCADGLAGTRHWFRYWAWAYDPRAEYMPLQPFVPFGLYPHDEEDAFQWRYIEWLEETTFKRRKSGLVEKARDMGATLGWLLWATHHWLFYHYYSALLASANEDLVDSKRDPDTLFEKVRFVLRLQPPQLLPEGFDLVKDLPYMNLSNPENGSTLSGQAPTANAGRQRRRTCVLKDESAAWPYGGFPQNVALSAVSYSMFDVSSVQGKFNQFYKTAHTERVNKFIMDWREHPWKDQRWYDALSAGYLGPAMSAETIAQEVDRDYDASQPGKVFPDWEETRTCVEWPEVLEYYRKAGFERDFYHVDGTLKIPDDWTWARMQDKGETTGHPRMTLWCARPAMRYPLHDSVFFFAEHMAPTAADLDTVVRELTEVQRRFHIADRRPAKSVMSHEASKDQAIYAKLGWWWNKWDTDYESGIGNIRLWIKAWDLMKPNPIRPALMGRSKVYLVCAPGQATLCFNEKDGKYYVTAPKSVTGQGEGFARLRAEFPVYHYPPEEMGKALKDQRPERIFDDALACFVAGTPVLTRSGDRPIESIQAGDYVATRCGWRRVREACKTGDNAVIYELKLSNGQSIHGTGGHPIWVENQGWTKLQYLRRGDVLAPAQKWWNTEALSFIGIPTPSNQVTETISSPTSQTQNAASKRFISKFGRITTDLYLRALTFTTKKALKMPSTILSALLVENIGYTTARSCHQKRFSADWMKRIAQKSRITDLVSFAGSHLRQWIVRKSIVIPFAKNVGASDLYWGQWSVNAFIAAEASSADRANLNSFAAEFALHDTEASLISPTNYISSSARNAEQPNRPIERQDTAPVVVKGKPRIVGYADVYNLAVDDPHEYFAAGILVHNCMRGVAVLWGPQPKAETDEEKRNKKLAPELRKGAIASLPMGSLERDAAIMSQSIWLNQFKAEEELTTHQGGIGPLPTRGPVRRN